MKNTVIRAEVKAGTPLGIQAKDIIEKGNLLPDETVINIIADYISRNNDVTGTIFDGFPRTLAQSEAMDSMLKAIGSEVTGVISLEVEDQELVNRILIRSKSSGRADDSDESIIRNRIQVYKSQTSVVKDYYAKQNKVAEIKGVGSIDGIFEDICKAVDSLK